MAHPEVQVRILNEFLLTRLAIDEKKCLAFHLAQRVTGSAGQFNLPGLSREVGYSPRHLDRIYRECFGISPKFHARIVRFQGALRLLIAHPEIELLDIVEACGYYDQPHLSKEFTEFAGQSPNQYRAHLVAKMIGPTPPNLVQFLQDV